MDGTGRVLEKFWRDSNGEIDWHSASWLLHPERAAPGRGSAISRDLYRSRASPLFDHVIVLSSRLGISVAPAVSSRRVADDGGAPRAIKSAATSGRHQPSPTHRVP